MVKVAVLKSFMNSFGGGERVAANLCNDLSSDFEIHLVIYNSEKSVYALNKNVKIIELNKTNKCSRLKAHLSILKLREFLKSNDISVLMIIGRSSYPLIPIIAALNSKTKVVFCEQSTIYYNKFISANIGVKIYRYITQFFINHFTEYITVLTTREKKNYLKAFSLNKNKIIPIYNYIDFSKFRMQDYNITKRKIITVARIDYAKGLELLIEVAAKVLCKHPDWRWDVYGDGDEAYKKEIIQLIDSKGLSDRLLLMGNCDDIYKRYPEYDLFVFTSRYEGFGLTLLEAISSGVPAVSFDINSGPSDIIRNNINGYLVEPYNIEDMAGKICFLIENTETRRKFARNTRIDMDKFEKERIISTWKGLILDMTQKKAI